MRLFITVCKEKALIAVMKNYTVFLFFVLHDNNLGFE